MVKYSPKVILIVFIFFTFVANNLYAAPIVISVKGNVSESNNITVSGSGFGTKSSASPIKWDNFEDGNEGSEIGNGWFLDSNQRDKSPRYASFARPGSKGKQSAFQNFTDGNYNSTIGLVNQKVGKIYISGWYYNETSGAPSRNVKTFAFRGGASGQYGLPNVRFDQYPVSNSGHIYVADNRNNILVNNWKLGGNLNSGVWHRIELWFDQGYLNQNNGKYIVWRDLNIWAESTETLTTSSLPHGAFKNIYVMPYFSTDTGSPKPQMRWYWDELYIDNTLARVELGNAAVFEDCTHREIQVPNSWTDKSINVTINQGSFSSDSDENTYLFVVDTDGNVSDGYPIIIGTSENGGDDHSTFPGCGSRH